MERSTFGSGVEGEGGPTDSSRLRDGSERSREGRCIVTDTLVLGHLFRTRRIGDDNSDVSGIVV